MFHSKVLRLVLLATLSVLQTSSQSVTVDGKCHCPDGFKLVEVRKQVCGDGACEPRKLGSLGFVIDNTGSMGAEIFAVRTQVGAIMANNSVFQDYVVGTFGDPYAKNVIRSSDASTIQKFVNAIIPTGGGDCPEFAMSGIEDAAKEARENSVLILFTDAAAKDANKTAQVTSLLKSKNTKLFVIGTGSFCGSDVYKGEFGEIAKATGGGVMSLTAKTSVNEVLEFIGLVAAGKYSLDAFPTSLDELHALKPPTKCCKWIVEFECQKVEEPCPFGFKRVTMRNRVCAPPKACQKKPIGSLGFVIDNTGSMGAEIFAVRTQVGAIMANNSVFQDYVVGTFGDPYAKNVIRSSDASTIQTFVDSIAPSGGGDCPEFAMSGIEDAAKEARENSVLILFTDAAAKDANRSAEVASLLVSKNTKLFVIGTGSFCGPDVYTGEFDYVAKATGGSVMKLTAKTSIGEVLNFIGLAASGAVSLDSLPATLDGLHSVPHHADNCWTEEISTCMCDCYARS